MFVATLAFPNFAWNALLNTEWATFWLNVRFNFGVGLSLLSLEGQVLQRRVVPPVVLDVRQGKNLLKKAVLRMHFGEGCSVRQMTESDHRIGG